MRRRMRPRFLGVSTTQRTHTHAGAPTIKRCCLMRSAYGESGSPGRHGEGDRRHTRYQCNRTLRLSKRAARVAHGDARQRMPQHQSADKAAAQPSKAAGCLYESEGGRWFVTAL
eukprot:scaffold48979_cov29-Tisochrysis_lutea.AAC.2